jgi:deoxyribose-phosphate aldolase
MSSTTERLLAHRILGLLDLTDLSTTASAASIERLCERAVGPHGAVAAVCVWPAFVAQCARDLAGTPVEVATVVNFPHGGVDVDAVRREVHAAVEAGADELDVVLPYGAFLAGDLAAASAVLHAVGAIVERRRLVKVILETGEFPDQAAVASATRFAIDHGADFVKTSTGKTPVSATPEAVATMLGVIHDADRLVGIKPSGGIGTLAAAAGYLAQADDVMGPAWARASTFRFGASGLLDRLVAVIDGHPSTGVESSTS